MDIDEIQKFDPQKMYQVYDKWAVLAKDAYEKEFVKIKLIQTVAKNNFFIIKFFLNYLSKFPHSSSPELGELVIFFSLSCK